MISGGGGYGAAGAVLSDNVAEGSCKNSSRHASIY
jgi:hypothetical protein